jgi:dolichyl-phosphate beta-glucosyltransferase
MMDADGATRVSDLERLEAKMKELLAGTSAPRSPRGESKLEGGPLGFVLGSRAHLQEAALAKRTWTRNVLMLGFHTLVTLVVGGGIRDTQCGFKLFTRGAARLLFPNQRLQRWAFDVELVRLAQTFKVPIAEVQVAWTEIPGSKVRLTSIVHIAFELAMVGIGYNFGFWRARGPAELIDGPTKKQR